MRPRVARTVFVFALVVVLAAAAASAGQANRPSQARTADEWTTTQIQAKYFLDPEIKLRTIHVSTINGVVSLSGRVASSGEKERASDIAARVPGVRNVENRLTVDGGEPAAGTSGQGGPPATDERIPGADEIERVTHSDPVILSQIKAKYAVDPRVSAIGIDVDVDDGVVTLRGDVGSADLRQRAETLAREVPGVKDIRNELKVKQ